MEKKKLPEIVYKYRQWSNDYHKRLLTQQEAYLSSPKDLNDPFDCRVTANFGLLDTDDKIMDYVKVIGERSRLRLARIGQRPEDFELDLFDRLKNNSKEEQESWDKQTFLAQDDRYGVFSLSARWDSILMWGHYSASHTGFCVGFDEKMLQDSGLFGRGGLVNYVIDFPSIHPSEDYTPERAFLETFTKAEDWQYECEYRLFKFFKSRSENRLVKMEMDFYKEIVLGLNFLDGNLPEVFNIADDLKIPVYRTFKVRNKFLLDRVKIKS
jgi:hypothetical protein